ncbi:hypothetical protein [Paenibacillus aestuarii]|uniref:Uncharacterized protein n=1 Tax=Paenibacillus aestuarii TaxID=516965 RepID=A0ABW0K8N3_9BACL|nr:hypothetical protein [Paenibacillus aestuarii]
MLTWFKFFVASIDFIPMLFFSFVTFRIKVRPYWRGIALAIGAAFIATYACPYPLVYLAILFVLFTRFLKFNLIPAVLLALSGYMMSVIVSTAVIFVCDKTGLVSYSGLQEDSMALASSMLMLLGIGVKCLVLLGMVRLRLGFTFLTHYYRITLCKENAGFYLFILTVLIGIGFGNTLENNTLSALMPVQILSIATALFIYVTLREEFGI